MVWPIIASMYIGNIVLVILNLPLVPVFASILRIPYHILYPGIIVVSLVGVYSINGSLFDVWLVVIFGLLGYIMRKTDFPAAPMVLAFVLGPLFEQSLRRSLVLSQGDPTIFLTRPWAVFFLAIAVLMFLVPALLPKRGHSDTEPAQGEPPPEPPPRREEEDADATHHVDEKHKH